MDGGVRRTDPSVQVMMGIIHERAHEYKLKCKYAYNNNSHAKVLGFNASIFVSN
jgi:hypothetical protein